MLHRMELKCCALPEPLADCRIRRTDTLVETELGRWIARRRHEIDPLQMNRMIIDVDHRFLFLKIVGDLVLDSGTLSGLRTLHRSGECFRANNRNDRMRLAVDLAAGTLEFECQAKLKLFNMDSKIFTLHVDVDYVQVYIDFCYNFKSGLESVLHEIILSDARGLRVWVSGCGILGWIANPFVALAARLYKANILNWIQDEVGNVINLGLYTFQFPYSFIGPALFDPKTLNGCNSFIPVEDVD